MTDSGFTFIDLFCGIGGFHQAMTSLGGRCVFASDIDEHCRKTYFDNYGLMPAGDITKIAAEDVPPHDVLCAGFPCQAFSKAGKRLGFEDETKGTLFFDIIRIVRHHKPKYLLLENVRNIASHDGGNTWRVIYHSLTDCGYDLLPEPIIFSPHYIGIPQHRERVYILCVRKDAGSIPPFHFNESRAKPCNIESVLQPDNEIDDLQKYQLSEDYVTLLNLWDEFIRNIKCDRLPGFPIWSEMFKCKGELSKDDFNEWTHGFLPKNAELYEANREFMDDWLVRAKRCRLFYGAKSKLEWQAGSERDLWTNNFIQFRPSGIRIRRGTCFSALVAIGQNPIVGNRRRVLTIRECARLQSFPDSFRPCPIDLQAYKQFGNSVNIEIIRLMAKYLFGDSDTRKKYGMRTLFSEGTLF